MIEYPTKILPATDGTEYSAMATEAAVALSNKTGAELHVVHVGQAHYSGSGVTVEGGGLPGDSYEAIVERARKLWSGRASRSASLEAPSPKHI